MLQEQFTIKRSEIPQCVFDAADFEAIIADVAASRITERGATRADDNFSESAMEDRKREGYF